VLPGSDLVLVVVPALIWLVWWGRSRFTLRQLFLRCILVIYVGGVVGVTMFPLPVQPEWIRDDRNTVRATPGAAIVLYNSIPGASITESIKNAREDARRGIPLATMLRPLYGNIMLYVPLGYLLPWVWPRWRSWWRVALFLGAAAVAIELIQLLGDLAYGFPYRRVDIDDVILNLAGGMVGYGLYCLTRPLLHPHGDSEVSVPDAAAAE